MPWRDACSAGFSRPFLPPGDRLTDGTGRPSLHSRSPRQAERAMPAQVNRQILLKSRPSGMPGIENFELVERPVPEPREGEVLMRTRFLSLDPYMRGRMSDAKSYAKPGERGQPMVGGTVGQIIASRNPELAVGDIVLAYARWQDYGVSNGTGLRKLDPEAAPIPTAPGVLGMPGMRA